ncbi:MAG TPA: AAA family ATPase, partial [Polyangium sp.]|nr:AAA family ATPase [Polyangium sp.]
MKVPYAKSDFPSIRNEGYFFVDKTPYIARLEDVSEGQLVYLRPRRFGKSTLLSMLASYYDIAAAGDFDKLFGGLWIHEHPTPKKNAYLVLQLDFSPVASEGSPDEIRASFAKQVKEAIYPFLARYKLLGFSWARVERILEEDSNDTAAIMTTLLSTVREHGKQVYLLIDEYDHFGNRLISDGKMSTYRDLVSASGFVRSFYAAVKAFAGNNTIARTFITGVSPIVLDDLSSGFNVITHISQDRRFNAMVGLTQSEVERAVDLLIASRSELTQDPRIVDRALLSKTLQEYYDGYRFAPDADERMYNSTLVLYFLRQLLTQGQYPQNMLDLNARTDYGRLYALAKSATEQAGEVRVLLDKILIDGEVCVPLVEQFGTRIPFAGAQVASLFYYMGMLTMGPDAANEIIPTLVIPNRVMRELQWE